MTFERGAEEHENRHEFTADDFDFETMEQEHLGFDELALSSVLSKEKRDLLVKLLAGRLHNQEVSANQHAFTQAEIAKRMGGLSQPYVSQLENGMVDLVGALTNYALAAGLEVSYRVVSAVDRHKFEVPEVREVPSSTTFDYSLKPAIAYVGV